MTTESSLTKFILKCVPKVYFKQLKHVHVGYKNVTLLQFITLLEDNFLVSLEEEDTFREVLSEEWNPTEHIKYV